jgi:CHASE3 domain sensor protein
LEARRTYDVLLDVKRQREQLAAKQKKALAKVGLVVVVVVVVVVVIVIIV